MIIEDQKTALIGHAAEIVSAYVANNALPAKDMPELIGTVYEALVRVSGPNPVAVEPAPPQPSVSIKKSITNEFLICLEDGKKFKSLKRHLRTQYGMTADEYRGKWNLPADYPMVAPDYASKRSELARSMGLGRKAVDRRGAGTPAKAAKA